MPNTLIPIQTYTLTGNTASVTFSNIPQNYTDLKIVISARSTNADYNDGINLILNGSTSNFTFRQLYGTGSAVASNSGSTNAGGNTSASTSTTNTFGNAELYIPNYTSSNFKSISWDSVGENNATSAISALLASLWSSTASIISVGFVSSSSANFVSGSTFTLYGISNGVKAVGGTLTVAGGYAYHTFTSTGSFLPSQQIKGAEVLAVAGGGGGGTNAGGSGNGGGGGGAGGVLYQFSQTFFAGTSYTALVGSGGAANTNGGNSILGTVQAIGGGRGGSASIGGTGGSGGGGTVGFAAGTGTTNQGNSGGAANASREAGGGGGAGGAGGNGSAITGTGGNGTAAHSLWASITGTGVLVGGGAYYYGGGGSGGGNPATTANVGAAGLGGGGIGSYNNVGTAGTANTGGGGGGGGYNVSPFAGGAGGSGLIIVRYRLD
jgi:hypothetical protein